MSDDGDWTIVDEDDLIEGLPLDTEEGRDSWVEILLAQDEDGPDGSGWARSIMVTDGENMVIRWKFPDGTEEVFDVVVRRSISIVKQTEGQSN